MLGHCVKILKSIFCTNCEMCGHHILWQERQLGLRKYTFYTVRRQLGLTLARFTHLKRHTRFDDFIMLVWGQGSIFHNGAGPLLGQGTWVLQNSLYRGQFQKLLQCCQEPYEQVFLVLTIQKKV